MTKILVQYTYKCKIDNLVKKKTGHYIPFIYPAFKLPFAPLTPIWFLYLLGSLDFYLALVSVWSFSSYTKPPKFFCNITSYFKSFFT